GACVGVRGSRIKNIVDELGGEKIDIVRWNESSQILIGNALKPAEVTEVALCFELGRATVVVNDDQLSLAIGKRGQNVRLAARLSRRRRRQRRRRRKPLRSPQAPPRERARPVSAIAAWMRRRLPTPCFRRQHRPKHALPTKRKRTWPLRPRATAMRQPAGAC